MANAAGFPWPVKMREMHNHHMNSTVWNNFKFRPNDIVIATWGKSGTTWTQQIVAQLIFNGAEGINLSNTSPWVDFRAYPREVIVALEHLPHRRFFKTHLPVDALVFSPNAKYLYLGRDGRDAIWSFYNHHVDINQFFYDLVNDTPGLVGDRLGRPPATAREYFLQWFEKDGYP
jgi:aryl sulfotransferase